MSPSRRRAPRLAARMATAALFLALAAAVSPFVPSATATDPTADPGPSPTGRAAPRPRPVRSRAVCAAVEPPRLDPDLRARFARPARARSGVAHRPIDVVTAHARQPGVRWLRDLPSIARREGRKAPRGELPD